MNESYYITNLDIILLSEYYNLPTVLLSGSKNKENNKQFILLNKDKDDNYYFILLMPIKNNIPQEYRLFSLNKNFKINLKDVTLVLKTDIRISNKFNLIDYMKIKNPIKMKFGQKKIDIFDYNEDELLDSAISNEPKIIQPLTK